VNVFSVKFHPARGLLGIVVAIVACSALWAPLATGQTPGIHTAPVVVQGNRVKPFLHYPIGQYRLFRTDANGVAVAIPFQIDEINDWGDYVLDQGSDITAKTGNGLFDLQDELVFMGDDVGPIKAPKKWPGPTPAGVFELKLTYTGKNDVGPQEGAVYVAVYFGTPPPLSTKKYVVFNRDQAEVITSRYRYGFDQKNWLVSRKVEMRPAGASSVDQFLPLLDSTTFYLKADLKYFLTLEVNHASINSELEAWKLGPVRSLVRVSFHYSIMKLNFELGMYTEISFFSNAVFLPAIMFNPIDGQKSLNRGSGFYYGISLRDNPSQYDIASNMPPYKEAGMLDFLKPDEKMEPMYWVTAAGKDRMLYMEITPSKQMRQLGAIPSIYREDKAGAEIVGRSSAAAKPLGLSPVNLALYFDMTKFSQGEHVMAFRLFFENSKDANRLTNFKNLSNWDIQANRI